MDERDIGKLFPTTAETVLARACDAANAHWENNDMIVACITLAAARDGLATEPVLDELFTQFNDALNMLDTFNSFIAGELKLVLDNGKTKFVYVKRVSDPANNEPTAAAPHDVDESKSEAPAEESPAPPTKAIVANKPELIKGETIGERVRRLRKSVGYTQKQLGEVVGVSAGPICLIEGGSKPGDATLDQIAGVFRLTPEEIRADTSTPTFDVEPDDDEDGQTEEPPDDEIDDHEAPSGKPQSKGGSRPKGDDTPEFPPVNDSPGELVRATRESLNLSQADLAELIDVGATRLATFERRSTGLTAMELGRLADELGFDGADREKIGVERVTCG